MKYQPLDASTLPKFKERLGNIAPDTKPSFGKLDPAGLMAHLAVFVEMGNGKHQEKFIGNFLTKTRFFRWLALDVIPWPKGTKVPDSLLPPARGDLEAERQKLFAELDEFVANLRANPDRQVVNPIFGEVGLDVWARLHGRHFEHHLQQFGV